MPKSDTTPQEEKRLRDAIAFGEICGALIRKHMAAHEMDHQKTHLIENLISNEYLYHGRNRHVSMAETTKEQAIKWLEELVDVIEVEYEGFGLNEYIPKLEAIRDYIKN